jgi:GNAT superfamily N-acetyltransferase
MTTLAIDDGAPPATGAIREARRRDAAGLWALYREFQGRHAHALPGRLRGFADPEAHRDDLYAVLVAELNGEVVGLAEVALREDADRPGRGVGARLLAAAEARARDAAELRRDAWELADGRLPFYARRGYCTLGRTLVRPFRAV